MLLIWLSTGPGRVNDTLVGDPLLTVPLPADSIQGMDVSDASLCYEVYGRDDTFFNLLSDGCVSVNAHYTRVNSYLNVVDMIAIRAVDEVGLCRNLKVELNGCAASVDGMPLTSTYRSNGIFVRPYPNRVRISVPNCNETSTLIMWTICQNNMLTDPFDPEVQFSVQMVKFVIARGFNLNASSHGIIGQLPTKKSHVVAFVSACLTAYYITP